MDADVVCINSFDSEAEKIFEELKNKSLIVSAKPKFLKMIQVLSYLTILK